MSEQHDIIGEFRMLRLIAEKHKDVPELKLDGGLKYKTLFELIGFDDMYEEDGALIVKTTEFISFLNEILGVQGKEG